MTSNRRFLTAAIAAVALFAGAPPAHAAPARPHHAHVTPPSGKLAALPVRSSFSGESNRFARRA